MAEITIDRALTDPRLLGAALGDSTTWSVWIATLRAAFGLQLSAEQQSQFAVVAGGRAPPTSRVREVWCVAGRRSGKSRISAAIAVYQALFEKHRLAPGERGMVLVIAGSLDQARTVFGYVKGFLEASPTLHKEIVSSTQSEVTLGNGVVIGVHSNSFRTVRGRTLIACILDEVSFWRDEASATPDVETYRAVLPSLATTNGMLLAISTPYRKVGLLHQKHRDHFGIDDPDVLIVQGASNSFNPSLSGSVIAAQRAADPTAAGSEWDAVFRDDISSYLDDELIDAAIEHGRPVELPPRHASGVFYRAFADAAGGSGHDSYAISIGHKEGIGDDARLIVIDLVRGTAGKFDPQEITGQYAELLKEYRISEVTGDSYAGEWVSLAWGKCGIAYLRSELRKSQIYMETLPLFARGLVRLPDHPKLLRELRLLERATHRGGKDSVDHPRGGHDDHSNAVCGVLRGLSSYLAYDPSMRWVSDDADDAERERRERDEWQRHRLHTYLAAHGVSL